MKKLTLITLHGIGEEMPHYHKGFEKKLKKHLGSGWENISFHPIHYAPILQEPQTHLWEKIVGNPKNRLKWQGLRKFVLFGFSDAAVLEHSAAHKGEKYMQVQLQIQEALDKAYIEVGKDSSTPIVIVAHSLGAQIISNYLWDAQKDLFIFKDNNTGNEDHDNFRRLRNLTNLVTIGCNIPVFNAGIENRECFCAQHEKLHEKKLQWDNFYDPDDILGWPLKDLGPSYNFIKDHPVNVGNWLTSWNFLSHDYYWTSSKVLKPLADILRRGLAKL